MATVEALEFSLEIGVTRVVLEGDSKLIRNSFKDEDSLASFGHLISDVKLFVEFFPYISFSHVCCQGNFVTHNLIKDERFSLTPQCCNPNQFDFSLMKFTAFFY